MVVVQTQIVGRLVDLLDGANPSLTCNHREWRKRDTEFVRAKTVDSRTYGQVVSGAMQDTNEADKVVGESLQCIKRIEQGAPSGRHLHDNHYCAAARQDLKEFARGQDLFWGGDATLSQGVR